MGALLLIQVKEDAGGQSYTDGNGYEGKQMQLREFLSSSY